MERKKSRIYLRFRFADIKGEVVFLDIGAYSLKQAHFLFNKAVKVLKVPFLIGKDWWRIKKPEAAPKEGSFVMRSGEMLKL